MQIMEVSRLMVTIQGFKREFELHIFLYDAQCWYTKLKGKSFTIIIVFFEMTFIVVFEMTFFSSVEQHDYIGPVWFIQ